MLWEKLRRFVDEIEAHERAEACSVGRRKDADAVDAEMRLAALLLWNTKGANTRRRRNPFGLSESPQERGSERLWEGYEASQALERLVAIYEQGFRGVAADPGKALVHELGQVMMRLRPEGGHVRAELIPPP
jgi:hypothetical protein